MSMVSVDMIENLGEIGDGPIAQDTGGKWKWHNGKAGERDIYGREYGSPVNAPAPAYAVSPYYAQPQVYPPFYGAPISWASAWPFYRNQTPQSAFSPIWQPPYNPGNTDTVIPTTGPAASSYFESQFVASPPGTPAFALDFSASDDSFDSGMEGLSGTAEDLEAQAAAFEASGVPYLAQQASALRAQAAAYRQQQGASSGPSSADVANVIQGAGAAAANILKAFQEGRVTVAQAKTAGGFVSPPPAYFPPASTPVSLPGWAWGVGAAALGLFAVLAVSRK